MIAQVGAAMAQKGNVSNPIQSTDIVAVSYTGCNRRRLTRRLGANVVTVTLTLTTSIAASGYLSAEGFYEAVTFSLVEAKSDLTAKLAAACGCSVAVDSVKVALSTRWEPVETVAKAPTPLPARKVYNGGDCPNGCSGHGACSTNGCACHTGWGNGDGTSGACDQRTCPFEVAWVDAPSRENRAHGLRECAGRGICDREAGTCTCLPGFEGRGCRRSTCPNGCSGHGTCEYLAELRNDLGDAFKWTGNQPTRDQYDFEFGMLWDAYKTRACVCDPKWTGLDCSRRMCPRGDYAHFFALAKRHETQAIVITNVFTPGTDATGSLADTKAWNDLGYKTDLNAQGNGTETNGEFALTFRSTLNEEFTTSTMNVYNLTEAVVEAEINALPNKVVESAQVVMYRNLSKYNVTAYSKHLKNDRNVHYDAVYPFDPDFNYTWYDTDLVIMVTFYGAMNAGDVYALECKTAYCSAGCQPKMEHPLDFKRHSECHVVNDYVPSRSVDYECSGRGTCDDQTGICHCFQGYTDEFCSTRRAII